MRTIDIVYRRIKDRWNLQRQKMDARSDELEFLVSLLDRIEAGDKGVAPTEVKMYPGNIWACGNCGHAAVGSMAYKGKYCPECGERIEWKNG